MKAALLAGAIAGMALFFYQQVLLVPRIIEAEAYEEHAEHAELQAEADHHHDSEWKPREGMERTFFTAASTILTGIGFAALLLSIVTLSDSCLNVRRGLFWGLAGFACFALAPALGLPPLPPGVPTGDLRTRQLWWFATVVATAIGLFLMFATRRGWMSRAAGALVLFLPHAIGAPRTIGPPILPDHLVRAFALASIGGNALFWLILGAAIGLFGANRTGCVTYQPR